MEIQHPPRTATTRWTGQTHFLSSTHRNNHTTANMSSMTMGQKRLKVKPPEKGSFPLDHEGQCCDACKLWNSYHCAGSALYRSNQGGPVLPDRHGECTFGDPPTFKTGVDLSTMHGLNFFQFLRASPVIAARQTEFPIFFGPICETLHPRQKWKLRRAFLAHLSELSVYSLCRFLACGVRSSMNAKPEFSVSFLWRWMQEGDDVLHAVLEEQENEECWLQRRVEAVSAVSDGSVSSIPSQFYRFAVRCSSSLLPPWHLFRNIERQWTKQKSFYETKIPEENIRSRCFHVPHKNLNSTRISPGTGCRTRMMSHTSPEKYCIVPCFCRTRVCDTPQVLSEQTACFNVQLAHGVTNRWILAFSPPNHTRSSQFFHSTKKEWPPIYTSFHIRT